MRENARTRWRHGTAVAAATAMMSSALIAAGASPALAAPPAPDLHYTMDDTANSVVPDSSANQWDGTIVGATAVVAGESGGSALDLQGGHVTIPREVLEGATDLSVSTRVRWDGVGGRWQWLLGLGSDTTRYLFATPADGDGNLRTALTRSGAGAESRVIGSGSLAANEWTTLTLTLDTAADTLTVYLDGAAVSTSTSDVTASELLSATAPSAGSIGRSFYNDPAFDGAIDDFQVFRSALSADQVAELVGGDLPEPVSLVTDRFEVRTLVGEAPELPANARATFDDGVVRDVAVVWDAVPAEAYASSGVFTVSGTAAGRPVTAEVTVNRGEVRIDLAEKTGEFDGGASGLLYGLYGDGMPTANLVEGMNVRSVATKAQDGAQHPGSDALEILPTLAEADGDVYLRIVDFYRGFPYQWPGSTPEARISDFYRVLDEQLAKIETFANADATQRGYVEEHLVIEPFNEPEGNSFGSGDWSYNNVSWLDDPADYFAAWDRTYETIRAWSADTGIDVRIAGPGTSLLFTQVQGYLEHTVAEDTVPDIITWHELSNPATVRTSVDRFRSWEADVFAGTRWAGTELPININEYAYNYHTSVPGQMIQWISAIEEKKVEAMIAFWNINGNLSDSAVQQNRGNGQWWLYNAYSQMTGETVEVTPPSPGVNYTLQGLATLDEDKRIARAIIGGADGSAPVDFVNVPAAVFGDSVRVQVREIAWTGQLGDSAQPTVLSDSVLPVSGDAVTVAFGSGDLPAMAESSAYEIIVMPGAGATAGASTDRWSQSYEAEDAEYTGTGYSRNGPEGSPADVAKFYTSGGFNVGGLRTGSDGRLTFAVEVPEDGAYDLSVFANSLNTFGLVAENGPTNVFLTVDGAAEQELFLPLGYKWVVWDYTRTSVELTAGAHEITLAAQSLDGSGETQGDVLIDRITLERAAPADTVAVYEAELADHNGSADYTGGGSVSLAGDQSATFWVYGAADAEATLEVAGSGTGTVSVNGIPAIELAAGAEAAVHLEGGINKVVIQGPATVDALRVGASQEVLAVSEYQAEDARLVGAAAPVSLGLAEGGTAVENIGGAPGNDNALEFTVAAEEAGPHAVVVRFSNPEQVPATHYNPNPMARHADISVNGGDEQRVLFVPTFHRNNFWERTIVLDLEAGENTIRFGAEEQPNFDGVTYAEDLWPGIPLRADQAPIIDRITVSEFAQAITGDPIDPGPNPGDPGVTPVPGGGGGGTTVGTPVGNGSTRDGQLATTGGSGGWEWLPLGLLLAAAGTTLIVMRRRAQA